MKRNTIYRIVALIGVLAVILSTLLPIFGR